MTSDSFAIVSFIVTVNTNAIIAVIKYRNMDIIARSPPMSSPVKSTLPVIPSR